MIDEDAISLVKDTFSKLENAVSIKEIDRIVLDGMLSKNKMDDLSYPKINFRITKEDIKTLKEQGLITDADSVSFDSSLDKLDPLTKLLYSVLWKNGDLKKIKHIIRGINFEEVNGAGLVFHQFGKYLTKTNGEPIIDQHVIRAFGVFVTTEPSEIKRLRRLSILDSKNDLSIVDKYKTWLKSEALKSQIRNEPEYSYHIDKVLFALGKTIKVRFK